MRVPVTVSEHDLLGLLSIVSDHRTDGRRHPCLSGGGSRDGGLN
jgi:hypothetical protein